MLGKSNLDFAKLPPETFKVNREDMAAKLINQMQADSVPQNQITGKQFNDNRQDNPILSKLTELAKDPSTYSALASIGSVVAAAEGEDTMASALSNISSRIDQNVRSRETAKATVEAQKIKSEADAIQAEKDREAQIEAAKKRGEAAAIVERDSFKIPPGFLLSNPSQTFLEDPYAQKLGMFTEDPNTKQIYVNTKDIPKYLEDKQLAKSKLQANIADTKIRNEQINKVITDPNLQKIIGTVDIGPISVRKEFIASLGGTPEEVQTLLSIINTQDANKVLETLKKLKSQSRTGSTGFGALNEKELVLIKDAFINLNKAQDFETFVTNLKKIDETFSNATEREQKKYLENYKGEDIELYQNPYKQVATQTKTQDKSVSQPEFKGYKLVEN
jgi:hypothetical protein